MLSSCATDQAAGIMHDAAGSLQPIARQTDGCWLASPGERADPSAKLTVFEIITIDAGKVGLKAEGLFLCAEGDGRITLSRSECRAWELFHPVAATALIAAATESLPEFRGEYYLNVLGRLHHQLKPKSYIEIGTRTGDSLALAKCASLAVDPKFELSSAVPVSDKPFCALYQMTSDDFFATVDPTVVLRRRIDLAFLDGMHLSEFLLRDFLNVERFCHSNSVIVLHDCLPLDLVMAERQQYSRDRLLHMNRMHWWTGDVWRCALLLKRWRSDLRIIALDAPHTGLVLITNLDPSSTLLSDRYASLVEEMHAISLPELTLTGLRRELNVKPTSALNDFEEIGAPAPPFGD